MSFRARLLAAIVVATLAPLVLFAFGVRNEIGSRLIAQHERRIAALTSVIEQGLAREDRELTRRLATLAAAMPDDDRLRAGVLYAGADRRYVLDYAARAMDLAGLEVLQIQDANGRIVSSGHFRNDFDRLAPELMNGVRAAGDRIALARLRTPEGPVLAFVRADSVRIGGQQFTLVGGMLADRDLLGTFGGGIDVALELATPNDTIRQAAAEANGAVVREMALPFVDGVSGAGASTSTANLRIMREAGEARALQAGVDRWFIAALAVVTLGAIAIGVFLSARLSRPLARLAHATGAVSLEGPDLDVGTERGDEIGVLARRLASMTRRLRAGALQLRDAERRATVGDIARQVNHDIKNGLIPIRNVLRHLTEVQEKSPDELPAIFAARRSTLESSVGYLDQLARNYARLTPRAERRTVDLVAVASEVVRSASAGGAPVQLRSNGRAAIHGDPIAVRRILDNLVRNGVESLTSENGSVTVCVESQNGRVRLAVADTGRGMTEEELARAFDDFHTTKPAGTGLGLSVVRRLTSDLGGTVRIESAPGKGTTVLIDFPSGRE